MGVKRRAFTEGCTIGPPEDNEYAVDPVGVAIIKPSDLFKSQNRIYRELENDLQKLQLGARHQRRRLQCSNVDCDPCGA